MDKINISATELKQIIKEEAEKILSKGDALDMDMNQLDRVDNSDGSAYTKSTGAGKFEKKKADASTKKDDALEVNMNKQDGDQGHDEEIAAAVKVDAANSTMKGTKDNPHVEGMKNSDFESKKGNQSTSASTPYEDRKDKVDMNAEDREMDEGAKTYVEAGGEVKGGEKHTTGQKKAVVSDKAKNEKETYDRIAKGIELPEGFKNKKDLLDFINESAKKVSKLL